MNLSGSEPIATELAQRLRQQELIAGFGLFALREPPLQAVLDEACRVAAEGLETRFAKVLHYLPEDGAFLMQAGVGWRPGLVGQARFGADLASPAGYAFRTGRPVVSNHLSSEDRFRTPAVMAEHGILRAMNVLIGDATNAYGVLEVDSGERDDFEGRDIAFLQGLANVVAATVQRGAHQAALLRQKDLMMQEVHHRVRNSLQLVQTLLQLQARHLPDAAIRGRLEDAAQRVMTIAAVHKQLYVSQSIDRADLRPYLTGLLDDLRGALADEANGRSIVLEAEPAVIASERLTALGLVVAELVTNALKYGQGQVRVQVSIDAACLTVAVSDEGPGFPNGFDPARGAGLGMRLVLAMAQDAAAVRVDRTVGHGRIVVHLPLS